MILSPNRFEYRNGTPEPTRQLLGPDGKPITDQETGFLLPHYRTFAAIWNAAHRTYRWRFDEAMKHAHENALAMRRDAFITALLRERQLPCAQLPWSLEPEDGKCPVQKETARWLTRVIERTRRFTMLKLTLLEGVWYGRYAVQTKIGQVMVDGKPAQTITDWRPVNGDKIQYKFDGTPCVLINAAEQHKVQGEYTTLTDRGLPAVMLRSQFWRERFIIHTHEVEDADPFDGERAGAVHGIGLRDAVYWAWWMRDEMIKWMTDYLNQVGVMGLLVFWYDESNPEAKTAAELAARDASSSNAIAAPRVRGQGKDTSGAEIIPANMAGVETLKGVIGDFFERHIERRIVGQTLSANAEATGLGSEVAKLHADTKWQITKYDSDNLAETLTEDMVMPLLRANRPGHNYRLTFKMALSRPGEEESINTARTLYDMGIPLKTDEIRSRSGFSKPDEDDEVTVQQQMGPDGMPLAPGMDGQMQDGGGDVSGWLRAQADSGALFDSTQLPRLLEELESGAWADEEPPGQMQYARRGQFRFTRAPGGKGWIRSDGIKVYRLPKYAQEGSYGHDESGRSSGTTTGDGRTKGGREPDGPGEGDRDDRERTEGGERTGGPISPRSGIGGTENVDDRETPEQVEARLRQFLTGGGPVSVDDARNLLRKLMTIPQKDLDRMRETIGSLRQSGQVADDDPEYQWRGRKKPPQTEKPLTGEPSQPKDESDTQAPQSALEQARMNAEGGGDMADALADAAKDWPDAVNDPEFRREMEDAGLKPTAQRGAVVPFDASEHESEGTILPGTPVEIVSEGWTRPGLEGATVQAIKAKVKPKEGQPSLDTSAPDAGSAPATESPAMSGTPPASTPPAPAAEPGKREFRPMTPAEEAENQPRPQAAPMPGAAGWAKANTTEEGFRAKIAGMNADQLKQLWREHWQTVPAWKRGGDWKTNILAEAIKAKEGQATPPPQQTADTPEAFRASLKGKSEAELSEMIRQHKATRTLVKGVRDWKGEALDDAHREVQRDAIRASGREPVEQPGDTPYGPTAGKPTQTPPAAPKAPQTQPQQPTGQNPLSRWKGKPLANRPSGDYTAMIQDLEQLAATRIMNTALIQAIKENLGFNVSGRSRAEILKSAKQIIDQLGISASQTAVIGPPPTGPSGIAPPTPEASKTAGQRPQPRGPAPREQVELRAKMEADRQAREQKPVNDAVARLKAIQRSIGEGRLRAHADDEARKMLSRLPSGQVQAIARQLGLEAKSDVEAFSLIRQWVGGEQQPRYTPRPRGDRPIREDPSRI